MSAEANDLPHAHEAECAVTGALLQGVGIESSIFRIVKPEMFATDSLRRIVRAADVLHRRGTAVDVVSVIEHLTTTQELDSVGGMLFLTDLLDAALAANAEPHAQIVRDTYQRRQLIELGHRLEAEARGPTDRSVSEILDLTRGYIDRVSVASARQQIRVLSDVEVENMPKPDWLVDGMIPTGSLSVVFGPPGSGKSFLVIAMAMAIGTGYRVLGRSVTRGPVCYIAPEGSAGIGSRVRAWKQHHNYTGLAGVHFVPQSVSLLEDAAVASLIAACRALKPSLVVFDTLARSIPGGDENSAKDVGIAIANAGRIQQELGTAVLLVHHTGKGGEIERGSTALRGGADTMISVVSSDGSGTLACSKQKDAPHFAKVDFSLKVVGDSAIITAEQAPQYLAAKLTEKQLSVLSLLRSSFLESGASATQWLNVSGLPARTFYDARTVLVKKGYVDAMGPDTRQRYKLTAKGTAALTADTAGYCGSTAAQSPKNTAAGGLSLIETPPRSNGHSIDIALDLEVA